MITIEEAIYIIESAEVLDKAYPPSNAEALELAVEALKEKLED